MVDEADRLLLALLQSDGRISISALGRAIGMSAPATSDRIRRLEEHGIIAGYAARVALKPLGYAIKAYVRLKHNGGNYKPFRKMLESRSEVLECDHVTGDDCFIMKVAAGSMEHLEQITQDIARFGNVTTAIVYSTFLDSRPVTPALADPKRA